MRSSRLVGTVVLLFLAMFGAAVASAATLEDEVLAYEAQDRASPPPTGSVVVTGSSSIRLWTTIATDLSPLGVIARGFGGSTAADLDFYLERLVLIYQPRAVVIYEGDNDIANGHTPQQIADTMSSILARISARLPNARVYVISIKPSPLRWASWSQAAQANQLLAALCATDARYVYVNIVPVLLGSNGQPRPEYYQSDQLHLNAAGYAAWTSAVRPMLHAQQLQPLPADTTAPTAPSGLQATALSRSSIELHWNAASDSGSGLAGYRISRDGVAIATTTATRYTNAGLASNTSYAYTVSAYDRATPSNSSLPSAAASATTLADSAPTVSLTASPASVASGGTSTLSWTSTHATGCTASGGWSGSRGTGGSTSTGTLSFTTTYTLACTGAGGSTSASATVTVVPAPVVSLTATPTTVASGASSSLAWSTSNATSCIASGDWSGARSSSGTASTGTLTSTRSYTLTCTGTGGTGSGSATVTVTPPPPPSAPTVTLSASPVSVAPGGTSTLTWSSTNAIACNATGGWTGARATAGTESTAALSAGTSFALSCSGAGGTATATATVAVVAPPAAPTLSLTATPASVMRGATTLLEWSATGSTSCTATGGWAGSKNASGSETSAALAAATTFSLTCTGPGGSVSRNVAVAVTAPPPRLTLTASPSSVSTGSTSRLSWTATDASTCSATGDWAGERATSGDEVTVALSRNATFTLACTGTGGRVEASAGVTVTAEPASAAPTPSGGTTTAASSGSGGGGSFQWPVLLALAGLALRTSRRRPLVNRIEIVARS